MSEIDIVIPQDTNPIEITTPTATEETEVQAEETQNNTSYNVGGDAYYTDLAKDWAIKMNGKVLGQDYSSKYYAQQAKEYKEIAEGAIDNIELAEQSALSDIQTAKTVAITDIDTEAALKITEITSTASDFEDDLTALTTRAETAANNSESFATNAETAANNSEGFAANAEASANAAYMDKERAYNAADTAESFSNSAGEYAQEAETSANDAFRFSRAAANDANSASQSATTASNAATSAVNSAQQAEQAKEEIEEVLDDYVPKITEVNGKALNGNITLNASDVGALANTTKYGKSIAYSLDSTTYILTLTLKDQDNNALNSVNIDLPLESYILSVSYDNTTKELVITYQNGNTIRVPIGAIIGGLQTEITSTNMLSSDLVDDTNKTHKFVTAEEKAKINSALQIPNPAYATSTTAASTAEKVVSIPEITELNSGQIIVVSPTKSATVADLTIKLNNFTAYPILYAGSAITTSTDNLVWNANQPSAFIFNGSNWLFLCHGLDSNTTYSTMSVAEGVTGTATSNRSLQAVNLKQIIQGTTLTGLSIATASTVLDTDSITDSIGKLQAQINALPSIPTNISAFNNDSGYITSSALTPYALISSLATVATSGSYNDLSDKPYIPSGVIVDQTYDATSQNAQAGVAIAGALANYVTTNTAQDITGVKTFVGQKMIAFKQSTSSNKLGFTLYNNSGTEKGYLEYNPSNAVDSVPLMTLGNYATATAGLTHIGFRKYSSISGASGAYNLLAPLISDARTPFSLTTTYTNFYLPLGFTDGNTTVLTAKTGLVDISSLLPTVPTVNNPTITFTQGGVTKGSITLNQSSSDTIALDAGGGGGASALTDLSDVTITSASNSEALCYNGTNWVNAPKTLVTIKDWTVQ